jgi:hypothetical protein
MTAELIQPTEMNAIERRILDAEKCGGEQCEVKIPARQARTMFEAIRAVQEGDTKTFRRLLFAK